jgi:hypothetical protein
MLIRPLSLAAAALTGVAAVLAVAVPAAPATVTRDTTATPDTVVALDSVVVPGAAAWSAPSGAWSQFTSDLSGAEGLATGQGVTIADLASGADTSASGLAGKVTEGPDYTFKPEESLLDATGTLEAGLILGVPGVATGLAPDARILAIRTAPDGNEKGATQFYDSGTSGSTMQSNDAKAIRYAVAQGAKVILVQDASAAGYANTPLPAAVNYALSKNVVIVAADDDDSSDHGEYLYPAGQPGVIGVASTDLPGGPTGEEVWGKNVPLDATGAANSVVITAPGNAVNSSVNDWGLSNVTSAVCYVAATAALIRQQYPDLSPALVERAIAMSARDHPSGGYNTTAGFGILDPYDAVLDAGKLAKITTTAPAADGAVPAGTHFGADSLPVTVSALPSDSREVAAAWAAIAVGVILLALAVVLATRRRRNRKPAEPKLAEPKLAEPKPAEPKPAEAKPAGPEPDEPELTGSA